MKGRQITQAQIARPIRQRARRAQREGGRDGLRTHLLGLADWELARLGTDRAAVEADR